MPQLDKTIIKGKGDMALWERAYELIMDLPYFDEDTRFVSYLNKVALGFAHPSLIYIGGTKPYKIETQLINEKEQFILLRGQMIGGKWEWKRVSEKQLSNKMRDVINTAKKWMKKENKSTLYIWNERDWYNNMILADSIDVGLTENVIIAIDFFNMLPEELSDPNTLINNIEFDNFNNAIANKIEQLIHSLPPHYKQFISDMGIAAYYPKENKLGRINWDTLKDFLIFGSYAVALFDDKWKNWVYTDGTIYNFSNYGLDFVSDEKGVEKLITFYSSIWDASVEQSIWDITTKFWEVETMPINQMVDGQRTVDFLTDWVSKEIHSYYSGVPSYKVSDAIGEMLASKYKDLLQTFPNYYTEINDIMGNVLNNLYKQNIISAPQIIDIASYISDKIAGKDVSKPILFLQLIKASGIRNRELINRHVIPAINFWLTNEKIGDDTIKQIIEHLHHLDGRDYIVYNMKFVVKNSGRKNIYSRISATDSVVETIAYDIVDYVTPYYDGVIEDMGLDDNEKEEMWESVENSIISTVRDIVSTLKSGETIVGELNVIENHDGEPVVDLQLTRIPVSNSKKGVKQQNKNRQLK